MAAENNRFTKVLLKLESYVAKENYYEAHQLYRFLNSRYLAQKKYKELLDILYHGALVFLERDQQESGSDLVDILINALVESQSKDYEEWSRKLCNLFIKISPIHPAREDRIAQAIRWCGTEQGRPVIHQAIAQMYWDEKIYIHALEHFMKSKDGQGCAKFLIEFHTTQGYKAEEDLFIGYVVLSYLCQKDISTASQAFYDYTKHHPSIKAANPPYILPLLNFLCFLLQALETPQISTFVVLCEQYAPSIKRDPAYEDYLRTIRKTFFPSQSRSTTAHSGPINFFEGLFRFTPEPSTSSVRDMADVD